MTTPLAREMRILNRITAIPALLKVVSTLTGIRFVTITRWDGAAWAACAIHDGAAVALEGSGELDAVTAISTHVRATGAAIYAWEPQDTSGGAPFKAPGFNNFFAVPIHRKDGSFFGALCGLDRRATREANPASQEALGVFADLIGAQLEAEQRHEDGVNALTAKNNEARQRDRFIGMLGHDLRNPLHATLAAVEMLQRKQMEPKAYNLAKMVETSTLRMSKLVEDLLDFARGQLTGGIPVRLERHHDLRFELENIVQELRNANPERKIVAEIADCGHVVADKARLAQLASNLLGNAIQHGAPDEPVGIRVECTNGTFVLSVSNSGPQIAPEVLRNLFTPYFRSSGEDTGRRTGHGLGLYICAEIAKAHGGTLVASSLPDGGTTVTLTFPEQPAAQSAAAA